MKLFHIEKPRLYALCLSALCFLAAFLLAFSAKRSSDERLADQIAPGILRFHILANSDSRRDQQLKLEVKGLVIDYIRNSLGEAADKQETQQWISSHKTDIEQTARSFMQSQGFDYDAHLELTSDYFPTKAYGDVVFPCGTYEAVRITLGAGKGRNWWCVLYPPLCYIDSTRAVVPDSSKRALSKAMSQEAYEELLDSSSLPHGAPAPSGKHAVHVRVRLLDLMSSAR